jgi:hypothetical protein
MSVRSQAWQRAKPFPTSPQTRIDGPSRGQRPNCAAVARAGAVIAFSDKDDALGRAFERACCVCDRHDALDAPGGSERPDSVQAVNIATAAKTAMIVKRTDSPLPSQSSNAPSMASVSQ